MDEKGKLTQLEKLIRRIDFRIEVLKKKRKDVTLDMMVEIVRGANTGTPDDIMSKIPVLDKDTIEEKIPECCGMPVEIFELSGTVKGDWVAHCKHCWDGTTPQPTRAAAIEAWERECRCEGD